MDAAGLAALLEPLAALLPATRVIVEGAWEAAAWHGRLRAPGPVCGIAFLATPRAIFFARSSPAAAEPPLGLSLVGDGPRTFAASFHGAFLPGVPVAAGAVVVTETLTTARLQVLATAGEATLLVLLLPGAATQVGRNRLWRLREALAAELPEDARLLLTRRRAGVSYQGS